MSFATQVEAREAMPRLATHAHSAALTIPAAEAGKLERVVLNELERLGRIEDAARVLVHNMPNRSIERLWKLVG